MAKIVPKNPMHEGISNQLAQQSGYRRYPKIGGVRGSSECFELMYNVLSISHVCFEDHEFSEAFRAVKL